MKAEILAPAGSYESLRAAVAAGADAVYIGGTRFGARAYADNLSRDQLLEAIDFCHLHGRRLYLTVNTLLKDHEMEELYDYLLPFYLQGLDAVIVQDLGALELIRSAFPGLEIHASTQMTVTGAAGAQFLEKLGVSRVVTSRELSLGEIQDIRNAVDMEIESFVHGALCYCYSGQCLFSSLIGGRSGNRGRCAQPCRLPYEAAGEKGFLLSPKDICTLELLPDILEAGVYSLKIEGRMKRPEYTAGVVRIYRKYVDQYLLKGRENYRVEQEDLRQLMELYNRGGFTLGYYKERNGRNMISLARANHYGTPGAKVLEVKKNQVLLKALEDLHERDILESETLKEDVREGQNFRITLFNKDNRHGVKPGTVMHRTRDEKLFYWLQEQFLQGKIQENINGKLMICRGKPAILSVIMGDFAATVLGDVPGEAIRQPMMPDKVKKQIEKTGNTPFVFQELSIEMDEGLFMPLQSLNDLRRKALEELGRKVVCAYRRVIPDRLERSMSFSHREAASRELYASVVSGEQLEALIDVPGIEGIYVDSSALDLPLTSAQTMKLVSLCREQGKKCLFITPYIFRRDVRKTFENPESIAALEAFDGILIKNLESWAFFQEKNWKKDLILDHNMYTFNVWAREFGRRWGASMDTAPVELNSRELARRGMEDSELMVYGRLPMMVSAQCLTKTVKGCTGKPGWMYLKDRKGKRFPVKNNCSVCCNVIYNQVPLVLFENKEEIQRLNPARLRLSFTTETGKEAAAVARAFAGRFVNEREVEYDFGEFTRGHFKRGIE